MTAQEHLTLRAGCGPLDGPGPETRDDHAEEDVTRLNVWQWQATVRRDDSEATATGYTKATALLNAYARLSRVEVLEEAWARS